MLGIKQIILCMASLIPIASHAATITFQFDNTVQWASDPAFTVGVGTSTITNNTVDIPPSDYFQLGMSVLVTNNPNPASGGDWDQNNGTTQPPNLGLSGWGMFFTDSSPSTVVPLVKNGKAAVTFPSDLYAVSSNGAASAITGNVGTATFPMSGGILVGSADASDPSTFNLLTLGAATPQDIFTGFTYQANGLGSAVLTPTIPPPGAPHSGDIAYAINYSLGDANDPPTYDGNLVGSQDTTDTVIGASPLTVIVPEPGSAALILIIASYMLIDSRCRLLSARVLDQRLGA